VRRRHGRRQAGGSRAGGQLPVQRHVAVSAWHAVKEGAGRHEEGKRAAERAARQNHVAKCGSARTAVHVGSVAQARRMCAARMAPR